MSNLSEAGQLVMLFAGALLLLKAVANMDRYYNLRVFVLVTIFSLLVIVFFLKYGFTLGYPHRNYDCVIEFSDPPSNSNSFH